MTGTKAPLDVDVLVAQRFIAIVRAALSEHLAATARTLVGSGIHVLEFPLTTPGVLAAVRQVVDELGAQAHVGVGSVRTLDEAKASAAVGAQFLVTPHLDLQVVEHARSLDLPIVVGALSPTEIHTAWAAGATAVKVFPASLGGPGYVKELRSPYPTIPLVPTGGVRVTDVRAFLDAGAIALGIGGALLGSAPDGGSQEELRARVREFRAAASPIGT
jgi:2-dehydro-3-deoxyphosphogluconate aldolase / (4S)-4-hydroxy-2-oxoglutarate aldolase